MINRIITTRDLAIDGEYIYMYSPEAKAFLKMDKNNGNMSFLPLKKNADFNDLDIITCCEGKLYANEINGKHLLEYDIDSNKYCLYELNFDSFEDENIFNIFTEKEKIYIAGRRHKALAVFDSITKKMSIISYPEYIKDKEYSVCCRLGSKIYFFPNSGDVVFSYDILDELWTEKKCDKKWTDITFASANQDKIYLLDYSGNIYAFNLKNETYIEIIFISDNKKIKYNNFVITKDYFILLSYNEKIIKYYNRNDKTLSEIFEQKENVIKGRELYSKFYRGCEDDEWYYFANRVYQNYMKISKSDGKVVWYEPKYPEEIEFLKTKIADSYMVYEKDYSLKSFISLIGD